MRREILTVWVLLSAPIVGFIIYLSLAIGLTFGGADGLLLAAMGLSVISLFFLSWMFLKTHPDDWRTNARFVGSVLIFEGLSLGSVSRALGNAALGFGIGSALIGLLVVVASRRH